MEDTLRDFKFDLIDKSKVLILVLMEDTLRGKRLWKGSETLYGLNPCFNGRYSQSLMRYQNTGRMLSGLNPCFNGRYSQSFENNYLKICRYKS